MENYRLNDDTAFDVFQHAVVNQLDRMIDLSSELFYVDTDKDKLFSLYLASFPEGTDPIFRERTLHNCSSCKQFIRTIGHVVAVIDGRMESIWDIHLDNFYQVVADALSEKVKFSGIAGIYRHAQKTTGNNTSRETQLNGIINIYDHFYYTLPDKFVTREIASFNGKTQANKEVLERSLNEISYDASELVMALIEENALYRGQEHQHTVKNFQNVKMDYDLLSKTDDIETFLWLESAKLKEAGRFKNTVIGTLLSDISTGTELEDAVKKFETKVAPTNYKRPTALITQSMIDKAQETINDLGIEASLARRYATTKDLTANNLLFAGKSTKKKERKDKKKKKKGGILDILEPTKPVDHNADKVQEMVIDDFVSTIIPYVDNIEVMVENSHINNLMSIIAPKNPQSENIMKWDNPFSWSYNGEVADSIIKQRVKNAGGSVDGFMRCSLSWSNHDDLDIHAEEPDGSHIYYNNKRSYNGTLDVDMNVDYPLSREPVENITWENESNIQEGKYKFYVHNYTKRETSDVGFQVEMELDGQIYLFVYEKALQNKETIPVIEFTYSQHSGINIIDSLPSSRKSRDIWGITTQDWTKVTMLLNSPNFWNGEKQGNKHWFFILDGCLNPGKARGFYNEFLRNELHDHRKVFEVLSSKMKADPTDKQLSGIGFSSTQENKVLCKVSGKLDRIIRIVFAPNMRNRFTTPDPVSVVVGNTIGRCEVCKQDVTDIDSRLPCPHDSATIFHTSHFLESVRVTGKCPVCREEVNQLQINEIVMLPTV